MLATKQEKNREKNLKYPVAVFRIAKETRENLVELKGDQSWNLFFVEIINLLRQYRQSKK